jgi:hypothetical protein
MSVEWVFRRTIAKHNVDLRRRVRIVPPSETWTGPGFAVALTREDLPPPVERTQAAIALARIAMEAEGTYRVGASWDRRAALRALRSAALVAAREMLPDHVMEEAKHMGLTADELADEHGVEPWLAAARIIDYAGVAPFFSG